MPESPGARWLRRFVLTVLTAVVALPLLVMVTTALRPFGEVEDGWLPHHLTLRAFADAWSSVRLGRYLVNSTVVAAATAVLAIAVGFPAGWALARRRGLRSFGWLLLATQAVPGLLFLLPLFLLYARLEDHTGVALIGSYPGLVLTDLTFALPVTVWLVRTYVEALPRDIEDAARLDGAGTAALLLRVVGPALAAGLAATTAFAFLSAWGEVLFASVLTDDATTTVPVGLHAFATENVVYWNRIMAAALMSSLPVLAAFGLVHRAAARFGR